MFKKDIPSAPKQKVKSSAQRALRQSFLESFPLLEPHIDAIVPKKSPLSSIKLPDRATLYVVDASTPVFFQSDASPHLLPHLKVVHRYPQCFPSVRIDRGAIRFVLSGATLMAPGLTSKGGRLPFPRPGAELASGKDDSSDEDDDEEEDEEEGGKLKKEFAADEEGRWGRELEKGEVAVVMAEGKEEACAVGVLVVGTKEIKETKKGPVIEEAHFLGDGLWRMSLD